jgi:intracellular septation protein
MKLLLDFLPIVLFFVAFKMYDIYVATAVAIAASVLQIGYLLLRRQKVEPMQWASLAIIVVFGGMTLLFKDETFIKWKPTVLYTLFALGLLVARYAFNKNAIKMMMGKQIDVPAPVWDRTNLLWVAFFVLMAVLNIFVAYRYSTDTWVNFKLYGTLGLTLVFIVGQALYLGRFSTEAQEVIQANSKDPNRP